MPAKPRTHRRYPALSHIGSRKVPSSHTVNRLRTESHPNLAIHSNERDELISSAIDPHHDEITIDGGHYESNSPYQDGLHAPENWRATESQPNLSKSFGHNNDGHQSPAFIRDVGKVVINNGQFALNTHEYGKKSGA